MQFTEKEIELAKQLKEAGLEWKPEGGVWFLLVYPRHTEVHLCIDVEFSGTLLTWLWDEHPQYSVARHDVKDCVWLPLWHQCRKIIEETGYYLLLLAKGNNVQVDLWNLNSNSYVGVFRGETDLESMYKTLLEVLTNVSKNVNDE